MGIADCVSLANPFDSHLGLLASCGLVIEKFFVRKSAIQVLFYLLEGDRRVARLSQSATVIYKLSVVAWLVRYLRLPCPSDCKPAVSTLCQVKLCALFALGHVQSFLVDSAASCSHTERVVALRY
jgi:hypothetical protein